METRKKSVIYLGVLFFIFIFILQICFINPKNNINETNYKKEVHSAAEELFQKQWILNPNFTTSADWFPVKGGLGDLSDVNADISSGTANYDVLGEKRTFTLEETPINGSNWLAVPNPNFPYGPSSNSTVSEGLKVYHQFDDRDANQNPSVHWDRNFTMPVNMSDYVIKSASIQAIVNATVDLDVDCPGDTEATNGGDNLNQQESYDYVRFYVLVSDLLKNKVYEIAYIQPTDLGAGNPPGDDTLPDTYLISFSEDVLIFYLSSVLNTDNYNFTVTLGIRIYTADNTNTYDNDEFHELLIKSINLAFTYEKKIDQQTSISYNQNGVKISDDITIVGYNSFEIIDANLNFRYKINDTWSSASPNSEIRILMNKALHTEAIKLSTANTTFQRAKQGVFDISALIVDDVNLSIQLFLADEFELNRSISISIDDVSLIITYKVLFDDYQTGLQLFLNGENKTSTPSFELPLDRILNITVRYNNQTGGHISGAQVGLTGVGIIESINETLSQYSILINVSEKLNMGPNYLTIEATKTNYETKQISLTVTVRTINAEIRTYSGGSTLNIASGENVQLRIILNDTDNDVSIRGAIVTYTWDLDSIPKVLIETNGIYEGIIEAPPDGLFTIIVSAFASDDYSFESFQITLNVGGYIPQPETDLGWLINILIISFSGAIIVFVVLFSSYIKYWRYPPFVRKIRALKKKVRKKKKTKPILVNKRDVIIANNFKNKFKDLNLELSQPEDTSKIKKK